MKRRLQQRFCIFLLSIFMLDSGHAVEGEIEFGIGVSDSDFLFSPFPGINQSPFLVLNANVEETGEDSAWRITARDLGIDTRTLRADYENDAGYSLYGEYWQYSSQLNTTALTPFTSPGSSQLILPDNWVAGDNTDDMTNLQTSLRQFVIGTERRRYTLGGETTFGQGVTFKATATYEDKEGIELIGGAIGRGFGQDDPPYGVGVRATLMPVPIDYETTQIDLKLGYQKPRYGFELGYYLSIFRNGNDSLSWENPFSLDIGGGESGDVFAPASSLGRLALYPDNQFHRLSLSGNYLMGQTTRLYGMFSAGMMKQDQAFLPLSANPTLAQPPVLPVNNLDADAAVNDAYLRITSQPIPKLSLKAAYRFHSRDDDHRLLDAYNYYALDSSESGRYVISSSYYYRKQELDLSARYRIHTLASIGLAYEREDILRDYVDIEREDIDEDRFETYVDFRPMDNLSLWIKGGHSERSGSNYITTIVDENPLLRKYHLADRKQDNIVIRATYDLSDSASISASYDRMEDDYGNSVVGLQYADHDVYSLDFSYQYSDRLSFHGFVSHENITSQQTGSTDGVNVTWSADYDDTIDSFGAGVEWQAIPERLKLSLDLALSDGNEAVTLVDLSLSPAAQYPDLTSDVLSIRLAATYQYDKQTEIRFAYWHESLDTDDWALDDLNVDSTQRVLLTGEESPNYDDHVVMVSLIRHF